MRKATIGAASELQLGMGLTRFILVNVVVVFVLLEIVLRLQEPYSHLMTKGDAEAPNNLIMAQYHPVWHHQVRVGLQELELRLLKNDGHVNFTVTTNSWGCRYPEIVIPKPARTYRVIVIGDSFTQGYDLQDTVAVQLEQQLKADNSGLRYEILNCASATYSPLLMYLRLRDHLMQTQPDAIIVNVDQTDLYDDFFRYRARMVVNDRGRVLSVSKDSWRMIELTKVAMEWSAAVRTLVSTGHRIAMGLGFYGRTTDQGGEIPPPTYENIYWFHTIQPEDGTPRWQEAFEFLAGNVNSIIDLCAERGVHCAFTTYPHVGQLGGSGLQPKQHRAFSLRLRKLVENNNTFFYDAYEDIAAAQNSGMNLYFSGDMHFNQDGQRIWSAAFAKHLAPWVRKNTSQQAIAQQSPYPPGPVVESVTWDFNNTVRLGKGSDLWPVTWGADGYLYAAWGDGTGFGNGGEGPPDRVTLGFARVEGPPNDLKEHPAASPTVTNIWGGQRTAHPATFGQYPTGIVSVDGILYSWGWDSTAFPNTVNGTLAWSLDTSVTWTRAAWGFGRTASDTLADVTFLNYGRDNAAAQDGGETYLYCYALERGGPARPARGIYTAGVSLLRVPRAHASVIDRNAYEFFTGLDAAGVPTWSEDIALRKPVFHDPAGQHIAHVSYNPGLNRYLLTTAHGGKLSGLGVFDAPKPWGPWTTVYYDDHWGGFTGYSLGYDIPTKSPDWMSGDGKTVHLIFSGDEEFDSFNLIKGTFNLRVQTASRPPASPELGEVK